MADSLNMDADVNMDTGAAAMNSKFMSIPNSFPLDSRRNTCHGCQRVAPEEWNALSRFRCKTKTPVGNPTSRTA
eukprot:4949559-Alexandrium_andersonii.AAC.1